MAARGRSGVVAILALLCALMAATPASALAPAEQSANPHTRYSIVKGCFSLRSQALNRVVAGPFRMQATELGRYLLYDKNRKFFGTGGALLSSGLGPRNQPSESTNWRVDGPTGGPFKLFVGGKALRASSGGLSLGSSSGSAALFTFQAASGCPVYPEVETRATGTPARTRTSWGEIRGMIDLHMHMTAFEFLGGRAHCGRPWHPYGAPYALVDCPDHGPMGGGAVLENVLYGNPARTHDTTGWPTFKDWPHHKSLTHEQTYYKWLERAYLGGLRVFVNLMVENRVLCELYPYKKNNCDEMASVRLQNRRLDELQNYIDAQSGGPGKGWFRLVKSPFEARRVIARGKLAVIKGIEISEPFGCQIYNDRPRCDRARIDRELNEVYGWGVRQMEIINKFDNALAGVAGDGGETGVVTNQGNKYATGKYWDMQKCEGPPDEVDREQIGVYEHDNQDLGSNVLETTLPPGVAPVYPRGSSCNTRGLSELGEHAIRRLMAKGMIVDPDHLSVRSRKGLMSLLEAERYSGVVSSHTWSSPDVVPRIYKLGGVITPMQAQAPEFLETWREYKKKARPGRFFFGFGYGADQNGFATQFGPRSGSRLRYPFKSLDGRVTLHRQRSGSREFDLNKDGMAHYGLFPDWWQDMRLTGGSRIASDMRRGAEAYLQMWERTNGIPHGCRSGRQHFTPRGLGRHSLRASAARLLRRAGQPRKRGNRAWTYCVKRKRNRGKKIVTVLTPRGKVALVGSTAYGHRGLRARPGVKVKRLRKLRGTRRIGKRLWIKRAGRRARYVYGVRKGRVRFAAVVTRHTASNRKRLRRYLRLARLP